MLIKASFICYNSKLNNPLKMIDFLDYDKPRIV